MSLEDNILDVSKLKLEGDFEAQVNQLLSLVRLVRSQVEGLQRLLDDVQTNLGYDWPGCRVYAFGSIVTGLGIVTSDVDCYVELPPWVNLHNKLVFEAKNMLRGRPRIFYNLRAVPFAKVPILSFYHTPTQRQCDLNFTSQAGVENSQLLAYLLHFDPRALPLTIIIKYWSKVHKLTGTMLMPNYALTLLVIFYLQYVKILPPVLTLQQTVPPRIIDDWNTAFDRNTHWKGQAQAQNNLSLYQLLGGFFDFYSNFDYENRVISTYLGAALDKTLFALFDTIPNQFDLYKNHLENKVCQELRLNTKMCVQDPFDHSRNCAVAVHPKLFNVVMKYIKKSAQFFYEKESNEYLMAILTIQQTEQDDIVIKESQSRIKHPPPKMPPRPLYKNVIKKMERKALREKIKLKKTALFLYEEVKKKRRPKHK